MTFKRKNNRNKQHVPTKDLSKKVKSIHKIDGKVNKD